MSLLKAAEFRESPFQTYWNTGTMFDIHTGVFVPGTHGGMVLNGGLSSSNAFMGRPQMFKSTEMLSYVVRAMGLYPGSECMIDDTEYSLKKSRIIQFSPFNNHADLDPRIIITTPEVTSAEEFVAWIKEVGEAKLKEREKYTVQSMILDPKTGKPQRILLPTFVGIDSWSKLSSQSMQATFDTQVLGSSATNMVYMRDGNIKKMIMTQIPMLAAKYGMVFFVSAHVGEKYELNPYAQSPKVLQHMKSTEKPKEVGADFNFLISNSIEMRAVSLLRNPDKDDALYPTEGSSSVELNEVTSILVRCKNCPSGSQLPMVVSQHQGILSELSNYHYLRENKYFGLLGNQVTHKPAMTDVAVGRTKIREKLVNPEVARALEILAQMCYINENWSTVGAEVDYTMKPEVLAEKLLTSDTATTKDILQSRGYWTYDKENKQPYMSTYDVLAIAQGIYKSKLHGVKLAA